MLYFMYIPTGQVVRELEEEEVSSGYYGMLVDLFQCEDYLHRAVEQTAGNKLFFHVVQNRHVATRIIKELNRWLSYPRFLFQCCGAEIIYFRLRLHLCPLSIIVPYQ